MTRILSGIVVTLSESPAISLAAKATVVVALGLIGAWFARRSRAAVRHALLASTFSVLLALPIVSFLATPVAIPVPVAKGDSNTSSLLDYTSAQSSGEPASGRFSAAAAKSEWALPPQATMLLCGWFLGTAFFMIPIVSGLLQIRSLRRFGLPWRHGQAVAEDLTPGARRHVEVLLHESMPGPMTCGVLNPVIILPADAQSWDKQDLERALIHELEHVRRYDWAIHCIARIACAAYWFHPLVWIAWRQLALEAERSCDDAVLRSSEATAYADQLVGLARRRSVVRQSPVLAMANRSDLLSRVRAVLDVRQARGRAGAFLVAAACIAAAAIVLTMSPLRMVAAPQANTVSNIPKWDAVSIKPCTPQPSPAAGALRGRGTPPPPPPSNRVSLNCRGIVDLVYLSYGVYEGGRYNGPVAGVVRYDGFPAWTRSERYTIEAKAEGTPGQHMMLGPMLQTILADRFRLKVHMETREGPVYILSIAKGGPKMEPLKPGGCAPVDASAEEPPTDPCPSKNERHEQNYTLDYWTNMDSFTRLLTVRFADPLTKDTPVLNQTGLSGYYHIQTEFLNPQVTTAEDGAPAQSIFSAVEKLGLKLEAGKGPRQYLVFDHAERPSEN
jgi:uncharacterized protein (TIGR03435 family)